MKRNTNFKDLTGRRFSKLIVVRESNPQQVRNPYWECLCDCGNTHTVDGRSLRSGHTKSCGCHKARLLTGVMRIRHGDAKKGMITPEYSTWLAMRARCSNPANKCFHRYGGRGIKVCERWNLYENFIADMGKKPSPIHSIDRLNSNGNYEPSNCRWATPKEQANNSGNNHWITIGNKTMTLTGWAEEKGISICLILNRISRGWTEERAVSEKVKRYQCSQ